MILLGDKNSKERRRTRSLGGFCAFFFQRSSLPSVWQQQLKRKRRRDLHRSWEDDLKPTQGDVFGEVSLLGAGMSGIVEVIQAIRAVLGILARVGAVVLLEVGQKVDPSLLLGNSTFEF